MCCDGANTLVLMHNMCINVIASYMLLHHIVGPYDITCLAEDC